MRLHFRSRLHTINCYNYIHCYMIFFIYIDYIHCYMIFLYTLITYIDTIHAVLQTCTQHGSTC